MIDIGILGATGRMGKRLIALATEHDCRVVAAIVSDNHRLLGRDAGEIAGIGKIDAPLSAELRGSPNVLIDFSAPPATRRWLETCQQRGIAMLIGTTGLTEDDHRAIDDVARQIPILQSPNMSLGIAVLTKIARDAARAMGSNCDIEIVEAHHRTKKDAPSGTALELGSAIRPDGSIPVHSQRLGDEVGRHTIYLATAGERLELAHIATSRDTFARGALRAASWLAQQKPAHYRLPDVLGI